MSLATSIIFYEAWKKTLCTLELMKVLETKMIVICRIVWLHKISIIIGLRTQIYANWFPLARKLMGFCHTTFFILIFPFPCPCFHLIQWHYLDGKWNIQFFMLPGKALSVIKWWSSQQRRVFWCRVFPGLFALHV